MRKFKLQTQTSVDGYMAGPNGEMDWMTFSWTDDINAYVEALTEPVDCGDGIEPSTRGNTFGNTCVTGPS